MSPSQISAYQCSACQKIYRVEQDARKCCACEKCGTDFERKPAWVETKCGHCMHGERLRDLRKAVRRIEQDLEWTQKKLERTLSKGRPEKGSIYRP